MTPGWVAAPLADEAVHEDRVLANGKILTVDAGDSVAEAGAMREAIRLMAREFNREGMTGGKDPGIGLTL